MSKAWKPVDRRANHSRMFGFILMRINEEKLIWDSGDIFSPILDIHKISLNSLLHKMSAKQDFHSFGLKMKNSQNDAKHALAYSFPNTSLSQTTLDTKTSSKLLCIFVGLQTGQSRVRPILYPNPDTCFVGSIFNSDKKTWIQFLNRVT